MCIYIYYSRSAMKTKNKKTYYWIWICISSLHFFTFWQEVKSSFAEATPKCYRKWKPMQTHNPTYVPYTRVNPCVSSQLSLLFFFFKCHQHAHLQYIVYFNGYVKKHCHCHCVIVVIQQDLISYFLDHEGIYDTLD